MGAESRGERLLLTVARMNRWATRNADLNVPPAQARLLAIMQEMGPSRIVELAAADHCSQPTMTTQVQRVEAFGWVERQPDPSDKRAWLLQVTPEGRKVLRKARTARAGAVAKLLDDLTPHEQDVLDEAIEIMQRMVARA